VGESGFKTRVKGQGGVVNDPGDKGASQILTLKEGEEKVRIS